MTQRLLCADGANRSNAVAAAVAAVRRGELVLLPTETVYGLAADAFSPVGVDAVRELKSYDRAVPLPVMVGSRSTVPGIAARVSDAARALMDAFWPGPLTLMLDPQPTLAWDLPAHAPLAVRMPMHPVALAVLSDTGPLVVTTANLPGMEAPVTVADALTQLGEGVALALDAGDLSALGRPGLPSTIIDARGSALRIEREGAIPMDLIRQVCPHVELNGTIAQA